MVSEITNNVIKGIITGVIIVGAIILLIAFFPGTLFASVQNLFNQPLDDTALAGSQNNFQLLLTNIDKCLASEKTNCLCAGIEEYPGSFARNTKLYFTGIGTDTEITLRSGNTIISNNTKKTIISSTLFVPASGSTEQYFDYNTMAHNYDNIREKWVDYTKEPPFFGNKNIKSGPFLISGKFYKKANDRVLYLIFTEKEETKLNEANIPSCTI